MKAGLASLLAIVIGSACYADKPSSEAVSGTYLLQISDEARASFRLTGTPEPKVRLRLAKDNTFEFLRVTGGVSSQASGRYELRDTGIVFDFDGESPLGDDRLEGSLRERGLCIGGLNYVRERETRGSFDSVVGTWTVRRNGFEDKSIKLVFDENGTFKFKMSNATSAGKYQLEDGRLVLLWTEVDGEAVELGSMRKAIRLGEDGSFKIDTFRYQKAE